MQFAFFLYATHYATKRLTAQDQKRDSIAEIYTLGKSYAIGIMPTDVATSFEGESSPKSMSAD